MLNHGDCVACQLVVSPSISHVLRAVLPQWIDSAASELTRTCRIRQEASFGIFGNLTLTAPTRKV